MVEVVLPIAVMTILLLMVDQIRRLISHAIVNGTIRQAIKNDPSSVPLLVAKLENGGHFPGVVVGWVLLAGAATLALAAMFEAPSERGPSFEVATVAAVIGISILAYARWVAAKSPKE